MREGKEVVSVHGDHLHVSALQVFMKRIRLTRLDAAVSAQGLPDRLVIGPFVCWTARAVLFIVDIHLDRQGERGQTKCRILMLG